jgi:hypothetical protein
MSNLATQIINSLPNFPWKNPFEIEHDSIGTITGYLQTDSVTWIWEGPKGEEEEKIEYDKEAYLSPNALIYYLEQLSIKSETYAELFDEMKEEVEKRFL